MKQYDPNIRICHWFVNIVKTDEKRRENKEKQFSKRLSDILLSEKMMDDVFCKISLPKIIEQYANEVEKNSLKFLTDLSELQSYELEYFGIKI